MTAVDITGMKFGRLTALYPIPGSKFPDGLRRWHCKCECGKEVDVKAYSLRCGNSTSCGCYRYEMAGASARKDLTGMVFGNLTAIRPTDKRSFHNVIWEVKCKCGRTAYVSSNCLTMGNTRSCGHCGYQQQMVKEKLTRYTPEEKDLLRVFKGMYNRCYRSYAVGYRNYGGRGIRICDEWLHDKMKFVKWALDHGWRKGLDIDRYPDMNGPYSPDNCRIVTREINCNNTRNNVFVTIGDQSKTCSMWDKYFGFPAATMCHYVQKYGKDVADKFIEERLKYGRVITVPPIGG